MVRARSNKSYQFNPLDRESDNRPPEDLAGLVRNSKLRSPYKEERESACIAMANLASQSAAEPLLKLVAERLIDSSMEVQLAALHALYSLAEKNLTSLLNCGVLEMLEGLLSSHYIAQGVYANSQEEQLGRALACEALELISRMSEISGSVHSKISESVLVDKCIEMLQLSFFALPTSKIHLVNLLSVLSEDNRVLSLKLMSVWGFIQSSETSDLQIQIAKAGLLLSIASAAGDYSLVYRDVIPIVLSIASLDLMVEFESQVLPVLDKEESHKLFETWEGSVRAVKQAFEILTNTFNEDLVCYEFLDGRQTTNLLVVLNKAANGLPIETLAKLTEVLMCQSEYLSMQCAALTCLQNVLVNTSGNF